MGITARDIMTVEVITAEESAGVNDLIELLLTHKISCVPVVNDKKKLVGIVTKTDVLAHMLDFDIDMSLHVSLKEVLDHSHELGDLEITSITDMTVGEIMISDPISAEEDTDIVNLASRMIEHNIHRLVIVNDDEIAGIVSTMDILHHIAGISKLAGKKP